MSPQDHGMDAKVGPLDQWDEIMIGHKLGDKLGSFVNHDGDTIRRNKPVLKDKGGKSGRLYVGPAKSNIGSDKEPGSQPEPTSEPSAPSQSSGVPEISDYAKKLLARKGL